MLERRKAPARLSLGATFTMRMKMGVRYETRNVVVDFEENRSIAWHHVARFVWRYDLEQIAGGTQVTESFTYDKPWDSRSWRSACPRRTSAPWRRRSRAWSTS